MVAAMTTTDPGSAPTTTSRGAGPLTTVFHTPEFCDPGLWTDFATPPLSSSICMPPNFMKYFGNRAGMYSPGICPMGYTAGCAFPTELPTVKIGDQPFGGPLLAGETGQICCPTSYTCFTGPQTYDIPYRKCISAGASSRIFVNDRVTYTSLNMAYAIQVRWQSSDLSSFETDPTVPGSTFQGPTATSTPDPGDDGPLRLPLNIVLAICIAVFLIALLLGIVAWLFWRRHFWKQQTIHRQLASTPDLVNGRESHFQDQYHQTSESESSPMQPAALFTRQPRAPFSRPATAMTVSPLTPGGSDMHASLPPTIHEVDANTRPWLELETKEEVQELPMASTSFAVELEGSAPAGFIPRRQQQRSQRLKQKPEAYTTSTTSTTSDEAVDDKSSYGGGTDGSVTRRRKSLGANRLTQQNLPPPYNDGP
ncbi:hypothetical protein PG989_000260 [Apiospora arundinis]